MKKIISAAAFAVAIATTPAFAKTLIAGYIYYVDEYSRLVMSVELSDAEAAVESCDGTSGLHVAQTMVTNRSIYPRMIPHGRGCYYVVGDQIYVWVNTQEGPIYLKYNEEDFIKTPVFEKWPSPVARSNVQKTKPSEVKKLIESVESLNNRCRGGSGGDPKTEEACQEREKVIEELQSIGWCWRAGGVIEAQNSWVECS